jgi:flagellar FliL protein
LKLPALILVILTTALVAGGAAVAAAYYFVLPAMSDSQPDAAERGPAPPPPPLYFQLSKALLITLDSRGGAKYLQLSFSVMARHEEVISALAAIEPKLRNDLIIQLGAEDPATLRTPEGRERLRQVILTTAQSNVPVYVDPETRASFGVEDVLLTNLVMQ